MRYIPGIRHRLLYIPGKNPIPIAYTLKSIWHIPGIHLLYPYSRCIPGISLYQVYTWYILIPGIHLLYPYTRNTPAISLPTMAGPAVRHGDANFDLGFGWNKAH